MTSTHRRPPTAMPDSIDSHEDLIQMYDGAMNHLAHARCSCPMEQKQSISSVVKILSHLKETSEGAQTPETDGGDLSALYAYMIDRLSIGHSALGIDPINEVNWLIRNLREFSAAPKRYSQANG